MTKNPQNRLGFDKEDRIKQHSFFGSINWEKLERREVQPEFRPQIGSATDVRNFEREFIEESTKLSQIDAKLTQHQQTEFRGFSFVNDEFHQKTSEL